MPYDWLKTHYPTTIVNDRFGGTYSKAEWLAFPFDYYEVPEEVDGDDIVCQIFWDNYDGPVGKGASPKEAFDDLEQKLKALEAES